MRTMLLKSIPVALSLWFAGAAHAQIKIAVAGPITGANASFGAQLTQGVEQAVEDINKAGGILGQKVEVEPADDVSEPKQGVAVARSTRWIRLGSRRFFKRASTPARRTIRRSSPRSKSPARTI